MNWRIRMRVPAGIIAFAVLAGLCMPAAATPLAGFAGTAATPRKPEATVQVNHHRYWCYGHGRCGGYWGNGWRHHRYHRPYRSRLYIQPWPDYAPAYRYVQPRRSYPYARSAAHVRWCYSRYRSYRERDNTFQPYHGPRRQCWSPYS